MNDPRFKPCPAVVAWWVRVGRVADAAGVSLVPVTVRAHDREAKRSMCDVHPAGSCRHSARVVVAWSDLRSDPREAAAVAAELLASRAVAPIAEPDAGPIRIGSAVSIGWVNPAKSEAFSQEMRSVSDCTAAG